MTPPPLAHVHVVPCPMASLRALPTCLDLRSSSAVSFFSSASLALHAQAPNRCLQFAVTCISCRQGRLVMFHLRATLAARHGLSSRVALLSTSAKPLGYPSAATRCTPALLPRHGHQCPKSCNSDTSCTTPVSS